MGAGRCTSKRGQPSYNTGLFLALPNPLISHCWGRTWSVFPSAPPSPKGLCSFGLVLWALSPRIERRWKVQKGRETVCQEWFYSRILERCALAREGEREKEKGWRREAGGGERDT